MAIALINAVNTIDGDNYVTTVSLPQGVGCLDKVFYDSDTLPFAEIQYSTDHRSSRQPQSNDSCVNATDFRVIFGSDFVSGPTTLHWHIRMDAQQLSFTNICSNITFSSDSYQYAESINCQSDGESACLLYNLNYIDKNSFSSNLSNLTTQHGTFTLTGTVGNTGMVTVYKEVCQYDYCVLDLIYSYTQTGSAPNNYTHTLSLSTGTNLFYLEYKVLNSPHGCLLGYTNGTITGNVSGTSGNNVFGTSGNNVFGTSGNNVSGTGNNVSGTSGNNGGGIRNNTPATTNTQNTTAGNNNTPEGNKDKEIKETTSTEKKVSLKVNEMIELYKPDLKKYVSLKLMSLKKYSKENVKTIPKAKKRRLGPKMIEKVQMIIDSSTNATENKGAQLTKLIAITRYIQDNYKKETKIYYIAKYIEENIIKSLE